MTEPSVTLFGPLDTIVGPYIEYLLLALVLLNLGTRLIAHNAYRTQAADGADAVSRHPLHLASTWALVLASLYYMTLHHHPGLVLSTMVVGLFITDFFEFEARKVEAREDLPIERPKSSLLVSTLVLLYTAYVSVFFLIENYWNAVI
ncbi:MAG: hypothetical protein ABEJ57_07440 [Halobacteriaceae archaeon]